MLTVRTAPIMGLIAQVALLAVLDTTVGLGVAGWLAGAATGAVTCAALIWGLRRAGADAFGPANWVTLTRSTLVGGVAALVLESLSRSTPVAVLIAISVIALILDAVDGHVARRTGTAFDLGARFDMEVDAFLLLVLSVYVARSIGAWVLAIGAMRYAYVAASWVLRWLRRPVPRRYWRKVVAATQGVVLVVAAADILPVWLVVAALMAALALLVESFGRDIVWQWRCRHADRIDLGLATAPG